MVNRTPYRYQLKKPVYTANRLQKLAKNVENQCLDDRKNAKDAYDYFKKLVEAGGEEVDYHARTCMLNSLKLMQTATQNLIKNVETATKITTNTDSKTENVSLFEELTNNDTKGNDS